MLPQNLPSDMNFLPEERGKSLLLPSLRSTQVSFFEVLVQCIMVYYNCIYLSGQLARIAGLIWCFFQDCQIAKFRTSPNFPAKTIDVWVVSFLLIQVAEIQKYNECLIQEMGKVMSEMEKLKAGKLKKSPTDADEPSKV